MLYTAAVSLAAGRVEQFLAADHVATLYDTPSRVHFDSMDPPLLLERSGVPIPRTFYCHTADRDALRRMVERLGGFPVVVKTPGGEGGVGTMRADSFSGLFSLVDYIRSRGTIPRLVAYVPDAVHWRAVVVGDRVVAAYPNVTDDDDFRTHAPTDASAYTAKAEPAIEAVAVAATRAFGYEFGGVDVLRHPSGRLYVLEVNMPCYFPQAQLRGGIDVAGAIVDHLRAKSERLVVPAPSR
jgi:glutathione synthase/RimK-type ligase-like ATP-grasp enzyme